MSTDIEAVMRGQYEGALPNDSAYGDWAGSMGVYIVTLPPPPRVGYEATLPGMGGCSEDRIVAVRLLHHVWLSEGSPTRAQLEEAEKTRRRVAYSRKQDRP